MHGVVSIKGVDGSATDFNVSGGFLSVSNDRVSILTETVAKSFVVNLVYSRVTFAPND
jgi:F0F1-type ATP synthase epsilon subunit